MSEGTAPTLFVIDDDERLRPRLARALEARGYAVRAFATGEEALAQATEDSPEYAIVDLKLAGIGGLDVVRGLLEIDASTRVLVLTGYGSIATAVEAVRRGAVDYLTKPADADQLVAAFARAQAGTLSTEAPAVEVPSLARVEWEHIQRVLAETDGNVTVAAKVLGIHRRSLQRKLGKLPGPR